MKTEEWAIKAALEIDLLLAKAVRENTGIDEGFFSGVSIDDTAAIIQANAPPFQLDAWRQGMSDAIEVLHQSVYKKNLSPMQCEYAILAARDEKKEAK